jgi:sterol 24-C-methyltransferase
MKDFQDDTFDGAFAFEATCHAKDPVLVYKEVCRTLKPGALFADMTWCVTDTYDPQDPEHVKVVEDVMVRTYTYDTYIAEDLRLLACTRHNLGSK